MSVILSVSKDCTTVSNPYDRRDVILTQCSSTSGIAIGNVLMKPHTGTYFAKFDIACHSNWVSIENLHLQKAFESQVLVTFERF